MKNAAMSTITTPRVIYNFSVYLSLSFSNC